MFQHINLSNPVRRHELPLINKKLVIQVISVKKENKYREKGSLSGNDRHLTTQKSRTS